MPRIGDPQPLVGHSTGQPTVETDIRVTDNRPEAAADQVSFFGKLRRDFDAVLTGARTMTQSERDRLANAGLTADAVAFLALQDMVDPTGRHGFEVDADEIGDFIRLLADAAAGSARGLVDARQQVKSLLRAVDDGELDLRPKARRLAEKFVSGDLHPIRHHGFFAGNALDAMRILATGLERAIQPTSLAGKLLSVEEAEVLVGMAMQLPRALQAPLRNSWAEAIGRGDTIADAAGQRVIQAYVASPLASPPGPAVPAGILPDPQPDPSGDPAHRAARAFLTPLFCTPDLDAAFGQMSDTLFYEDGEVKPAKVVRENMRRDFTGTSSNNDVIIELSEPQTLSLAAARSRFGVQAVDTAVNAFEQEGVGSDAYDLVGVGIQIAGLGAAGDYLVLVSRLPGEEKVLGIIHT